MQPTGKDKTSISNWVQSLAHRISPSSSSNDISSRPILNQQNSSLQNKTPTGIIETPKPSESSNKPQKPIIITFLGDNSCRNLTVINSLLRGSVKTSDNSSTIPNKLFFPSEYQNPLKKQQIHGQVHPPDDLLERININLENEALYLSSSVIQSRESSFYDLHSFLLPQEPRLYTPSLRILYGGKSEIIITYPSVTTLRTTLFQLHQISPNQDPSRIQFLKIIYQQIIGSLPNSRYQTPNQIIIPEHIQNLLGKTISYKSKGNDFLGEDRFFIRESLREIFNSIGCLAVDIFIRVPCGILQGKSEICVITSDLIRQPETRTRLIQILNFSEIVICSLDSNLQLSSSTQATFAFSQFLIKFCGKTSNSYDLLFLDIKSSQKPSNTILDINSKQIEKTNVLKQIHNILQKSASSRVPITINDSIKSIKWLTVFPDYYNSQFLPSGNNNSKLTTFIPLLGWYIISWPLIHIANQLECSTIWNQLKNNLWNINTPNFMNINEINNIQNEFNQLILECNKLNDKLHPNINNTIINNKLTLCIRNIREYELLLKQRFPMIRSEAVILILKQYSWLLTNTSSIIPSLVNSNCKENYHTYQEQKIPYRKPIILISPTLQYSKFDEKTGKQLFHPLGNYNQQLSESRKYIDFLKKQCNFQVTSVQQGANSQFRAFAHQVYGDENAWSIVKLLVINDILQYSSTVYQYVLDASLIHLYLHKLNNSELSGDHVTLCALANVYQTDIMVFSPLFPLPIRIKPLVNNNVNTLLESEKQVYALGYFNGRDYKSLFPSTNSTIIGSNIKHINSTVSSRIDIDKEGITHHNKYRKIENFIFQREVQTLSFYCIKKIVEYSQYLPSLCGALPEELVQKIITKLITTGKFNDFLLEKLLDESITTLDLSKSNAITTNTCKLISRLCPFISYISLESCLNISNDGIIELVKNCGNTLHSINLSGCISLTDSAIIEISVYCKKLVRIDLTGCIRITSDAISKLSSSCPLIESLTLKNCKQITDPVIESLGNQLQQLDLTECDKITDNGIMSIAMKSEQLKTLKLSGQRVTDKSLHQIAGSCRNLEHLELRNCEHISDESLHILTKSCKQLISLVLPNCKNLTPDIFLSNSSSSLRNLQRLNLSDCSNVTDIALSRIVETCPNLKYLNLSSCECITDKGLIELVLGCIFLIEIDLSRCKKLTDLSICSLAQNCTKLTKLSLRNCINITDQSIIELTKKCRLLVDLDISFCDNLTDNSIKQIPIGFPSLEILRIEELSLLTSECLKSLSSCSQLKSLYIGYCNNITDDVIISIGKGCPSIEILDISRANNITMEGLQKTISLLTILKKLIICRYSNISTIGFHHETLEHIDISWCSSLHDDAVLSICKDCPHLQQLNIAWCTNLTDSSLDSISKYASQIHSINIRGCSKISQIAASMLSNTGRIVFR